MTAFFAAVGWLANTPLSLRHQRARPASVGMVTTTCAARHHGVAAGGGCSLNFPDSGASRGTAPEGARWNHGAGSALRMCRAYERAPGRGPNQRGVPNETD